MAVPNKLPRSYYKRRNPQTIPRFRQTAPKTSTLTFGQAVARRAYWLGLGKDMADDARQVMKGTHLEATMNNWAHYKAQGRLTPEVAIIVDGSVQRPLMGVKVFGEIVIQEPPAMGQIYDAVLFTYNSLKAKAQAQRFEKSTGDYMNNIIILMDNKIEVPPVMFSGSRERLDQIAGSVAQTPFFTIIDTMPYAAKLERRALPGGIFYAAWKDTRAKYGAELAVRFRYYTADKLPISTSQYTSDPSKRVVAPQKGGLLSFPSINIGQPGAFNSGASPVIVKAAAKARRK